MGKLGKGLFAVVFGTILTGFLCIQFSRQSANNSVDTRDEPTEVINTVKDSVDTISDYPTISECSYITNINKVYSGVNMVSYEFEYNNHICTIDVCLGDSVYNTIDSVEILVNSVPVKVKRNKDTGVTSYCIYSNGYTVWLMYTDNSLFGTEELEEIIESINFSNIER